jgi:hypothetical protein
VSPLFLPVGKNKGEEEEEDSSFLLRKNKGEDSD